MKGNILLLLLIIIMMVSCGRAPVPRPYGYFRIDLPDHRYVTCDTFKNCAFEMSKYARIESCNEKWAGQFDEWYNVYYPEFDGTIHLSYRKITPNTFQEISEESRALAYKHTIRADAISESIYANDTTGTFGVLYEMSGYAASPVQFFISDSVSNFIRGSLYFNRLPNPDSIAPVSTFVEQDIIHLVETLKWKTQKQ